MRDSTGPRLETTASLSIAPVFSTHAAAFVEFDRVRIALYRITGEAALDTVIFFPGTADQIGLNLRVPLGLGLTTETFSLQIAMIQGTDTVFRGGPVHVIAATGAFGAHGRITPAEIPLRYSGVGFDAARLVIAVRDTSLFFADSTMLTAVALDSSGHAIPGTPIEWTTPDTMHALVPSPLIGKVVALAQRGAARVVAETPTGLSDTTFVTVQPVATALTASSGSGQSAMVHTLLPQALVARVSALDGLGVRGVPVRFAVTAGNGSVSDTLVASDSAGYARTQWTVGTRTRTDSVRASVVSHAVGPATFTSTVKPGPAKSLAVAIQPSNATAGAPLAPAILVAAQDTFGNVATSFGDTVTLALAANPSGATLSGTHKAPAVSGVATFDNVSVATAGSGYTLAATAGGLAGDTTAPFSVAPAAASVLAFTIGPRNTVAGDTQTVVVTVSDALGNTATGFVGTVTLGLGANPGEASLSGTTSVPAIAGVARFRGVSLDKIGVGYTLTAIAGSLSPATSAPFQVGAGAASQLVVTGGPADRVAGDTQTVVVTARDAMGNTATGFAGTVTLAIGANPGGATLGGTISVAAIAGLASFPGLTLDKAGAGYDLTATAPGLPAATSADFTITAGAAAKLAFTVQPSGAALSATMTPPVQVSVQDAYGNTVAGSTAGVTLAITTGTGTPGATLGGTLTRAAVNGVATFDDLTLDKVGTGYTLTAAATGLAGAISASFAIIPAAESPPVNPTAGKLGFAVEPSNAQAGAVINPAVQVAIQDASGNTVTSSTASVTLAITSGTGTAGAALGGTVANAAVNGIATFDNLTVDKAGTGYTLTATATGLTGAISTVFTVTAPPPPPPPPPPVATKLAFTVEPSNVEIGAVITPPVQVAIQDASGTTMTSSTASVTLAIMSGTGTAGATLSGTATKAAVNGIATFSDLSIDKAGTGYALTAASSSLTSATSTGFTITAPPPPPPVATTLAFAVEPSNTEAGAAIAPAVQVAVRDGSGNTVTSSTASVTLAITSGTGTAGAVLSGTLTKAAVNGVATFLDLSVNAAGTGYSLTATSTGLTSATSTTFTITAPPPPPPPPPPVATKLAFTVEPSNADVGAVMTPAVQVTIQDASGNTFTSSTASVTLAVTSGTGTAGAALGGTVTKAAVNGVATFSDLAIDKAGTGYTLTATSSGLTSAVSTSFTITAPPPPPPVATKLAFTVEPTSAEVSAVITPAVKVTIQDAAGNTFASSSASVTLAITNGSGTAGATLGGTVTRAAVNGVVTFSDLSINEAGTSYTLTATSTGLTSAVSTGFTIISPPPPPPPPPVATKLAFTVEPSSAELGAVITPAVQVAIQDASGNTMTSSTASVTLAITSGTGATGAALGGTVTKAAVNGIATFDNLTVDRAGTGYTLMATSTGLTGATSSAFTITAPPPPPPTVTLVFTTQPPDSVKADTSFTVVVTALDAQGKVATAFSEDVTLTFEGNLGSGLLKDTVVTAVAGVATFPGITVNRVGDGYTLTASANGVADVVSTPFTVYTRGNKVVKARP